MSFRQNPPLISAEWPKLSARQAPPSAGFVPVNLVIRVHSERRDSPRRKHRQYFMCVWFPELGVLSTFSPMFTVGACSPGHRCCEVGLHCGLGDKTACHVTPL